MSNVLDGLLEKVDDPALRSALMHEVGLLRDTKQFGLVFERHLPEAARLANHPIRRGTRVQRRADREGAAGLVARVKAGVATVEWEAGGSDDVPVLELVAVARFGEPIYPGLRSLGRVSRGGDKPFHVVMKAENYHALQTLQFTHRERVDVIYIDPPYNTGAKDWKYNNSFVDKHDSYRHSKWLSFVERRLALARDLLKPDGTLIVTIDENEQHHLMTLLEQMFPDRDLTPIVVRHNPRGIQGDNFSMTHETAVFATPKGKSVLAPEPIDKSASSNPLRNWGGESDRSDAKNCFYPIYVRGDAIVGFGEVLPDDLHPDGPNERRPDGSLAVWPMMPGDPKKGEKEWVEKKWRYARQSVEDIKHLLFPKTVTRGKRKGIVDIEKADEERPYRSVWTDPKYDANSHGSQMVSAFTGQKFPYPKSLYSVYEALYAAAARRPDAVILDFFAGSGTTLHATALLNSHDDGRRTAIVVTNNEVGVHEANALRKDGHLPGTPDFEQHGIAMSVTWPRVKAAVTGDLAEPDKASTTYKGGDGRTWGQGFEENVEFLELTYENPNRIARGKAFAAVAPLLWLAAGGAGPRVDEECAGFAAPAGAAYAVLFDPACVRDLLEVIADDDKVEAVFIVTDSRAAFQQAAAELPAHMEPVRLYSSYLHSFAINAGEGL